MPSAEQVARINPRCFGPNLTSVTLVLLSTRLVFFTWQKVTKKIQGLLPSGWVLQNSSPQQSPPKLQQSGRMSMLLSPKSLFSLLLPLSSLNLSKLRMGPIHFPHRAIVRLPAARYMNQCFLDTGARQKKNIHMKDLYMIKKCLTHGRFMWNFGTVQ